MTKSELVKKCWIETGADGESLKEFIDENGIFLGDTGLIPENIYDKFRLTLIGNKLHEQPRTLINISQNNGWKVTREGLPETSGIYVTIDKGREKRMYFTGKDFLRDGDYQKPTHWREQIVYSKPLHD